MKNKKLIITVSCVFITVVMALVAYLWKETCNNVFFNGGHGYFIENRVEDIVELSTCTFWEEAVFRMLPFLVATILIILSNPKWLRYSLYIIFGIIIFCIQIHFGALHYNASIYESKGLAIFIQGTLGLIIAVTYAVILVLMIDIPKETGNQTKKRRICNGVVANIAAYICGVVIHTTSNIIPIFTQTF